MDYEKDFRFTPDEARVWMSLKAPEKTTTVLEIVFVAFTNLAVTILLIYGVANEIFWVAYLAVTWILILTAQAINGRLAIRRTKRLLQSITEKVENRATPDSVTE